jgi:hypothetical protein
VRAKSWGEECGKEGEDALTKRGEGMVDLPTAVTFANQPGEGQTAGMLANGGEAGADEGTDLLER